MYTCSTGDLSGNYKKGAELGVVKEDIGLAFMPKFKGCRFSVPFGGTSGSIVNNIFPEQ